MPVNVSVLANILFITCKEFRQMNTPKHLKPDNHYLSKCEMNVCPFCGSRMKLSKNISGRKKIQTLKAAL